MLTPPGSGSGSAATHDPLLGELIEDRFRLVRVLGAGGMGKVYLAEDGKLSGRLVALKLMSADLSSEPEFRARFEREALLQANLRNGQIIQILDIGECSRGLYIVMEYSEGRNLVHLIKELAPLPVERALGIAEQILDVLDFAHRHDVAHRDLKPGNILVEERGGRDYVRILDFGIAKVLRRAAVQGESGTLTQTGCTVGTLGYMPPEQALGDVDKLDHRVDIYAAGVVLHEMLSGRVPTPRDHRTDPVHYAVYVSQNPVPSLMAAYPELKITKSVDDLVLGALHRSSEDRYPSALAFLEVLRAVRAGLPISSRPAVRPSGAGSTSITRTVRMDWRPARRKALATLFVLLTALVTLGGLYWESRRDVVALREEQETTRRILAEAGRPETSVGAGVQGLLDQLTTDDREVLRKRAGALDAQIEQLRAEVESASQEADTLREINTRQGQQLVKAESEAQAAGELEKAAREELGRVHAELAKARQAVQGLKSDGAVQQEDVVRKDEEIRILREERHKADQAAEEKLQALAAEKEDLERRVADLAKTGAGDDATERQLRQELQSKDEQLADARRQADVQKQRIERLEAENSDLRSQVDGRRPATPPKGRPLVLRNGHRYQMRLEEVTGLTAGGQRRPLPLPKDRAVSPNETWETVDLPDDVTEVEVRFAHWDYFRKEYGAPLIERRPLPATGETQLTLK